MGCEPGKPQCYKREVILIEQEWKGSIAVGPAPMLNNLQQNKTQKLRIVVNKLKNAYNFDLVVSLLEVQQMRMLGIQDQFKLLKEVGIQVMFYPIADYKVPTDTPKFALLVSSVVQNYLKKGKRVLVHCKNGKGRSGLFLASCMIYKGYNRINAIQIVRKWVPKAVQQAVQEQYLMKTLKF